MCVCVSLRVSIRCDRIFGVSVLLRCLLRFTVHYSGDSIRVSRNKNCEIHVIVGHLFTACGSAAAVQ